MTVRVRVRMRVRVRVRVRARARVRARVSLLSGASSKSRSRNHCIVLVESTKSCATPAATAVRSRNPSRASPVIVQTDG